MLSKWQACYKHTMLTQHLDSNTHTHPQKYIYTDVCYMHTSFVTPQSRSLSIIFTLMHPKPDHCSKLNSTTPHPPFLFSAGRRRLLLFISKKVLKSRHFIFVRHRSWQSPDAHNAIRISIFVRYKLVGITSMTRVHVWKLGRVVRWYHFFPGAYLKGLSFRFLIQVRKLLIYV